MSDPQIIDPIVQTDLEWSGSINRAAAQGEKFALLIAMLSDDMLGRPTIEKATPDEGYSVDLANYYRRNPLSADTQDWKVVNQANKAFHQGVSDGRLWCTMHPQPLAMYDDKNRLDEEVLANCSHTTQQRLKSPAPTSIHVDETGLYDVLESLHQ